jgi:methylglutaconyl-CoA hydratase
VSGLVHYGVKDGIASIAMNRPKRRNALNAVLVDELSRAFAAAADDRSVRAVVLAGEGPAFSAGADLDAMRSLQTASREDNLQDSRRLADLFRQIYLIEKPTIARVHGHAIAGGCGLVCACDLAVASSEARFGFTEVRLGFVPAIVMWFVVRKIGHPAAGDLLLSGRLVSADEAARIGLVSRVVEPAELDSALADACTQLTEKTSPQGVAATKRLLSEVPQLPLDEALARAAEANAEARATEDCLAGIRAFLDRTDPPWISGSD